MNHSLLVGSLRTFNYKTIKLFTSVTRKTFPLRIYDFASKIIQIMMPLSTLSTNDEVRSSCPY